MESYTKLEKERREWAAGWVDFGWVGGFWLGGGGYSVHLM